MKMHKIILKSKFFMEFLYTNCLDSIYLSNGQSYKLIYKSLLFGFSIEKFKVKKFICST